MAESTDGTDNGNGKGTAPGNGGTGGSGNEGDAGGAPGSGTSAGTGAGSAAAAGLDRTRLNPILAGMTEDQLNESFEALFAAARERPMGVPDHARQPEAPAAPAKPTKEELREYFDPSSDKFDPEAAMRRVVDTNYGSLIGDINTRSLEGLKLALKQEYPDMDEYTKEMSVILQGRPAATLSQQDILGAYFMAKGVKVTSKEKSDRTKRPTTTAPSAPRLDEDEGGAPGEVKLTQEDERLARIMFRNSADPIAEFRRAYKVGTEFKIRVPGDPEPKPTGGKK